MQHPRGPSGSIFLLGLVRRVSVKVFILRTPYLSLQSPKQCVIHEYILDYLRKSYRKPSWDNWGHVTMEYIVDSIIVSVWRISGARLAVRLCRR